MPDVQRNAQSITTTSATTAPAAGTSEAWTVTALAAGIRTLVAGETYSLVDATVGASSAQQAEIVRVTAATAGATSITVTRGCDGTTPVAHANPSTFNIVIVAGSVPAVRYPSYAALVTGYTLKNDFDPIRGVYNWKSPNTRILDQGLSNAMLPSGGQTTHIVIGDSVSAGAVGLVSATYLFDRLRAWPLAMRDQMANAGVPGNGTGIIRIVDGGAGIDSRVVTGGTWTGFSWGARTTVNGSTLTWSPDRHSTVADVWYYDGSGITFTLAIDGASSGAGFATVNTTNTGVWKYKRMYGVTVIGGVSTLVLTATTATATGLYITGADFWTPNAGVVVQNPSQSGASASGTGNAAWVDNSTANVLGTPYLNLGGRKRTVTDASCVLNSSTLTSATGAFTEDDKGKSLDQINLGSGTLMFEQGSYIGDVLTGTTVTMHRNNGFFPVASLAKQTTSAQSINIGRDASCVHIALGLNDLISLGASDATITAAITTIRGRFANSDCILHLTNEPNTTSVSAARMQTFQAAMYALADTLDVPLYDWRDRVGTYAQGAANGVYGDNAVHITAATSSNLGAAMAAIFGGGSGRSQTVGNPQLPLDVVNKAYIDDRKVKLTAVGPTATTTTETVMLRMAIPAGTLKVGDIFRYALSYKPALATQTEVRVRVGTLGTIADAAVVLMSQTAANNVGSRYAEGQVAVLATGGSSTIFGNGTETVAAISAAGVATATSGTFNSAVTNYVTVTLKNNVTSTTTTAWSGSLVWE